MWLRYSIFFFLFISCSEADKKSTTPSAFVSAQVKTDCPEEGLTTSQHLRELNRLKNRINLPLPENFDYSITSSRMAESGNDAHRWNVNTAVKIRGYITEVKTAGPETCNCKSKDKNERDTHMEISLSPMEGKSSKIIVVEVTPKIRKKMKEKGIDWTTRTLRDKYLGRFAEVEGWLFYDSEHEKNAINTNPEGKKIWRQTAWEVHPVTDIRVITKHKKE